MKITSANSTASFGVEEFSLERLKQLDRDAIEIRVREFKEMCRL